MNRFLIVAAACLLCGAAVAQKSEPSVSNAAFTAPSSPAVPNVIDNYDFEAAEGFAPGFLGGQAGWTVFTVSSTQPTIEAINPSSGAQHMRMVNDAAVAAGNLIGGFSPDLGPQPTGLVSDVSVDVNISGANGSDYDVAAQAPSAGLLTWRVNFRFTGPIRVLDGGVFVDTGVTWPTGTTFNLRVVTDPTVPTIDYYIDGALIYTATALVGAEAVEQVVLLNDNFQLPGETGDFDNLMIDTAVVPEADLTLTVSDTSVPPVMVGDQFDYILTAGNNGPGDASGVVVNSTLANNVDYVSDSCGSAVAGNGVTWSVGALASGASASCNVTVQVSGFGSINTTASISGDQDDPAPANNTAGGVVRGAVQSIPTLSFYGLVLLSIAFVLLARRRSALMN